MIDPHLRLPPLILASASARRREILGRVGLDFEVQVPETDERARRSEGPEDTVIRLSMEKGEAVASARPGYLVISADTLVLLGDRVLGKPGDERRAREMLRGLSGHWHAVWTGYSLHFQRADGRLLRRSGSCSTRVRFHNLEAAQIEAYVASGEPFDKAGAYGIQDRGALLVAEIRGCYFNVMGFPVSRAYRDLVDFAGKL